MTNQVDTNKTYAKRIYPWQLAQIPEDQTTHDNLMHAFQQYYRANLQWIKTGTKQSGQDVRYWLMEISSINAKRRKEILAWHKIICDKSNPDRSFKSATAKERKAEQKKMTLRSGNAK